jgi:RNA polymerase sigma-70 factor, ECF subfamily
MSAVRAERGVFCHQDTRRHQHPDTCQQMVISAQRGDSEAFRTLYDTYAPRLLGYLQALVGDNDAEDVASETWSRIHAALPTFRHQRGDFRAWAMTIARNQAISHLRYRRTHPADPTAPESFPHLPSHTDTEQDASEAIGTTQTLQLLRELPHTQATAVILYVIIGMDAATAGHILRKQPSAVRMAAHRGLKALRQLLDSR